MNPVVTPLRMNAGVKFTSVHILFVCKIKTGNYLDLLLGEAVSELIAFSNEVNCLWSDCTFWLDTTKNTARDLHIWRATPEC